MIKVCATVLVNPATANDHLIISKLSETMIIVWARITAIMKTGVTIFTGLGLLIIVLNSIIYAKYILLLIMNNASNFYFLFLQIS